MKTYSKPARRREDTYLVALAEREHYERWSTAVLYDFRKTGGEMIENNY